MRKSVRVALWLVVSLMFAGPPGCGDDDTTKPPTVLQFTFLDGSIGANLMPIVPPDPIGATAMVEIVNPTGDEFSNVSIPWADVRLAADNSKLGRIEFSTTWRGVIRAFQTDTVTVTKVNAGTTLFDAPCGQGVLLRIAGVQAVGVSTVFESDTLLFACVF